VFCGWACDADFLVSALISAQRKFRSKTLGDNCWFYSVCEGEERRETHSGSDAFDGIRLQEKCRPQIGRSSSLAAPEVYRSVMRWKCVLMLAARLRLMLATVVIDVCYAAITLQRF
jgi:hypothetical protein